MTVSQKTALIFLITVALPGAFAILAYAGFFGLSGAVLPPPAMARTLLTAFLLAAFLALTLRQDADDAPRPGARPPRPSSRLAAGAGDRGPRVSAVEVVDDFDGFGPLDGEVTAFAGEVSPGEGGPGRDAILLTPLPAGAGASLFSRPLRAGARVPLEPLPVAGVIEEREGVPYIRGEALADAAARGAGNREFQELVDSVLGG